MPAKPYFKSDNDAENKSDKCSPQYCNCVYSLFWLKRYFNKRSENLPKKQQQGKRHNVVHELLHYGMVQISFLQLTKRFIPINFFHTVEFFQNSFYKTFPIIFMHDPPG